MRMEYYSHKTISEIKRLLEDSDERERLKIISTLSDDPRAGVRKLVDLHRAAIARLKAEDTIQNELLRYERKLYGQGFKLVAGVDEAGRGALAGPIVAAAVILPEDAHINGLRDSKKLSAEQRENLYDQILETAVAWNVVRIEHYDIDSFGIQWANLRVLELAVLGLKPCAEYVLSDAFPIKSLEIPHIAITKGDSLSLSIAAASVLAKVTRDRIMVSYHEEFPSYGFEQHKGYATLVHKRAIERHGPAPIHRKCFSPVSDYEQLRLGDST